VRSQTAQARWADQRTARIAGRQPQVGRLGRKPAGGPLYFVGTMLSS
jgi:hypothetical protein